MSVSRRILLQVALGVAFVVVVVTTVTYSLIFDALKRSDLRQLDTYVRERAEREEARFVQMQSNMALVRAQFLERLEQPREVAEVQRQFDYWYRRYEDGAWRSREQFKDARKTASMWADREWESTPEQRRQVLVAQELCDEMLPGWVDVFPSYYLQFPAPGYVNVGVDTQIPLWAWQMPGHYDTTGIEWIAVALPEKPQDRFSWTGVQQDGATLGLFVCIYLPVIQKGKFIASVGHNMPLDGSLVASIHSDIPGASHFIVRPDGRLIAHPARNAEIRRSKGQLRAPDCGDPDIASLFAVASARPERRFSGFDPRSDSFYSVARLRGPEWLYITTMSRAHLQQEAFKSAQWVLWSGLISLCLVYAFVASILRQQISRPLADLTRAADAMADGSQSEISLASRADELGTIATSFREMVRRVAQRETELRELNASLERRVAERTRELDAALAQERELGLMKSNFVSLVSHEFRTPLGVIMSATDVLKRYFERLSQDKRERHLDMVLRSTRSLATLMEEVLLLGQVEQGRLAFTPVALDLEKLCRTLADELHSATGGRCPIHFSTRNSLAGAVCDESILRHILSNLLSNAVKYSPDGSPVQLTAERRDTEVILTIRDRGIGIPPEDQPRLFTSFTRGSNVGNRPGTGLGLVIVRRCVQLHGGRIALESVPGQGTTFTLTLPVYPPSVHP